MEEKVARFIAENDMFSINEPIGAAVSGGMDSMALLFLLKKLGFDVSALHFEHGIRGAESLRDADFVRQYCADNAIPFFEEKGDAPLFAEKSGMSLEAAARKLRYDFFESCGFAKIAVAHHSDDHIETVLHHVIRGSGMKGIAGIQPKNGGIMRPFLCVSKSEISEYCRLNDIPFVEDSTNSDVRYTRNRIRNEVVPHLKELNPRIDGALLRLSSAAADAFELIREKAKTVPFSSDGVTACVDAERLRSVPRSVSVYVLYSMFCSVGQKADIETCHFDEILSLTRTGAGKHIKNGCRAVYEYGKIILTRGTGNDAVSFCVPFEKRTVFPLGVMEICEKPFSEKNDDKYWECFSHIPDGCVVRTRLPGDVFKPLGGHEKKLKSHFIDAKIPRRERDRMPLLALGNEIIWVPGYALSDKYRVKNAGNHTAVKYTRGE